MTLTDDLMAILLERAYTPPAERRDAILTLFADYCDTRSRHCGDAIADEIRPKPRTVEIDREHLRVLVDFARAAIGDPFDRARYETTIAHVREIAPDVLPGGTS